MAPKTTTTASTSINTTTFTTTHDHVDTITSIQLDQFDTNDYYATAWADAVQNHRQNYNRNTNSTNSNKKKYIKWGGKGQGGRVLRRRTYQPKDIILDNINLEYCTTIGSNNTSSNETSNTSTTSTSTTSTRRNTILLEDASLKLLSGGDSNGGNSGQNNHIYAMIGSSGCGKSSFLRRLASYKIPGFPTHITTLYIPQEMMLVASTSTGSNSTTNTDKTVDQEVLTPIDYIIQQYNKHIITYQTSTKYDLQRLEQEMDELNIENEQDQIKLEELANCISEIEDELGISYSNESCTTDNTNESSSIHNLVKDSLQFMNIDEVYWTMDIQSLSDGIRKKIILAVAYAVCRSVTIDLLLLDEPTNGLDVLGLLKLRELISIITSSSSSQENTDENENRKSTSTTNNNNSNSITESTSTIILLVSHDIDFINSVATDVIDWYNNKLYYYNGNYANYQRVREQHDIRQLKQSIVLDKKRATFNNTIQNLKKKSNGKNNLRKQIESHKKKFTREIQTDYHTNTNNEVNGIERKRYGSDISSTCNGIAPPDKAIQFVFKKVSSQWHEPLIKAIDIGHTFNPVTTKTNDDTLKQQDQQQQQKYCGYSINEKNEIIITKKPGYLFDCIDICIEEGQTYCIVGENSCGKTTLLKLLSKLIVPPTEGTIIHANNIDIVYIDQQMIDSYLINTATTTTTTTTNSTSTISNSSDNVQSESTGIQSSSATTTTGSTPSIPIGTLTIVEYLMNKYPQKSIHEIRSELTNFGLANTQQVDTIPIQFLSGGERRRLCYVDQILSKTINGTIHVLVVDEPTCNLDPDSVNALLYGLSQWTNGTKIFVSHDTYFIRSLPNVKCYLLSNTEGKLRYIPGGIDFYLKSFSSKI